MKQAYSVILLLLALLPALAQDQRPAGACRPEAKYDRLADLTTVQCDDLVKWGEAPAGLTVQANVSFRGKEMNETVVFWLFLSSNHGGVTRHTPPSFKEAAAIYLSLDTAYMEIPVKDYRNEFFELTRSIAESARAEIPRESLQKLLDARNLSGKWGDVEFKFSDPGLASLKDFISRQVFAADIR